MLCMKILVPLLMMVIISGISLIGINQAFALFCSSNVAGTWNAPSTWTGCSSGVPDDLTDVATINQFGDVQLNNDFEVSSVSVIEGGSLSINAKLTTGDLFVGTNSDLFINCSGELIITVVESGSNAGLLTNHGILQTLGGVFFSNTGTYQSSGINIFGGTFSGNTIVPIASICFDVGGELIPLDTSALLLTGAQMNASWMIPVIVSSIGIAIVIARKF